jgi:nitrogen fixation NifU-like protein
MPFNSEEQIYQEHVLDHYEDPYHRGHCDHATHAHEDDNPLCGDVVRVELAIDNAGRIRQAWFDGEGCVISQASASMLMEKLEGKTVDEVRKFSAQQMLELFGPRLTPNRQKCCLLSWRVVQSALHSPVDGDAQNATGPNSVGPNSTGRQSIGPTFAGPDLGEES